MLIEHLHEMFFVCYRVSEKNTKKVNFFDFLFLPIFYKKKVKIESFKKVKSQAGLDLNDTTRRNDLFENNAFFLQLLCKNEK